MALLFRPIRMLILAGLAFVAGILFERSNSNETCAALGGQWAGGICVEKGSQDD